MHLPSLGESRTSTAPMGSYTRAGNCLPQADPETKLLSRLSFATRDDQPTLRRYISAFPRCTVTDSSCIAQRTNAALGMPPLSAAMSPRLHLSDTVLVCGIGVCAWGVVAGAGRGLA